MEFNPNATGVKDAGIFSLPFTYKNSQLILLPVPWEVTTSYGNGTSYGPKSIYECSSQIDLTHLDAGPVYKRGMFWEDSQHDAWLKLNDEYKPQAIRVKESLERGEELSPELKKSVIGINKASDMIHEQVYQASKKILADGKILGTVGGDHSSPLGAIRATSEKHHQEMTVIHIDAHADLRDAYQGYKHSHASIMRNVMEDDLAPQKLIQLGIRDFCQEELDYIQNNPQKVKTYFDRDLNRMMAQGKNWHQVCEDILKNIPTEKIYFSVDIDGFNPTLCPNTGTPVPGGLEFFHMTELIYFLLQKRKKLVGFDLCEVTPDSPTDLDCWDGNVGSRVLYNLCCYTLFSNV
ncbi:MAG: agmatinase family protein [Bdellovibrionales bacterium]|nr:agmatinase family protein [Bdellovibrionales bacterium]